MTKVAQIGCGYWGKHLARNFYEIGHLGAIVDERLDTATRLSAQYDVPARSFDAVLSDEEIGAVALATPASLHAEQAARALKAGKHCFVEKPLALNVADAERLIELAASNSRCLMVGHLLRYHPAFVKCLDLVNSGELGKLRYIYSNRLSLGKFRTEENVLWSFAPHDISMLLALAGEEPSEVSAGGMAYVTPGIVDWCTVQMQFPSGLRAHIQASWLHPFKEQRLAVIGEKAMLVFEDSHPEWERKLALYPYRLDRPDTSIAPIPVQQEPVYIVVEEGEPLKNQCRHFIQSIEGGLKPRTCGHEGLGVLRALAAAEASLQQGGTGGTVEAML